MLGTQVSCKIRDLLVCMSRKEVKLEVISSAASRITVISDRCFPLLFHNETSSWESVSTIICSPIPSGMSRTPSRSASVSAKRADPSDSNHRADAARKFTLLSHRTAPVAPMPDSCENVPSTLILRVPALAFATAYLAPSHTRCLLVTAWQLATGL
jgi:hypothetical protein